MLCCKLLLLCAMMQATMGLSPLSKGCEQSRPVDSNRRAASFMVATALLAATACPVPSFALSQLDKKDVTEIVTASEKRTNEKLTQISNRFELVPYVSTAIATLGATYSANKLDDALDRFSEK